MPKSGSRDLKTGTGPGVRGKTCDICMEAVGDDHPSISHVACQNTFHQTCFNAWADHTFSLSVPTTCPKCRVALRCPPTSSVPDSLAGSQFYAAAPWPIPPQHCRSFSERRLTTVESEMYDYVMGDGCPTTALLDRVDRDGERAQAWLADYFIRLSRAQNLNDNDAFARIAEACDTARRALPTLERADTFRDEIGPDEVATDREIIDSMGNRRPRPSLVRFFENRPRHAHEWLTSYMVHTQRQLGLDIDLMNEVKETFLASVRRALQARQQNA